jgi:hypothetical protein
MNPAERIPLIKAAAAALSEESWADMNLTLRQFGFSTYDDDGNFNMPEQYEYAVDRLESLGSDEALAQIQEFLFPGIDAGAQIDGGTGGTWKPDHFRLFISHTNAHRAFCGNLRNELLNAGIDAFVAHDQIEPTQQWQDEIETALATCDALAAVLTEDFVNSKWCDQEVGFAVARGLVIVPLSLGGVNPHGFVGKYQRMNAEEDELPQSVADKLIDLLARHEKTSKKMARQIVLRYANSYSFDNARSNFARLKEIPKEFWTPELAQLAEDAPHSNSQIDQAVTRTGQDMSKALTKYLDSVLGRSSPDDDIPF